ncbi:hypothetical protein HOY82DRAFT_625532, partial [Tuber indicum]
TGHFLLLSASPGDFVQSTFLENGDISKLDAADGTPGTIYWFGVVEEKPDETLAKVVNWVIGGKGGSGRGKLLAEPSDFEERNCVERNDTPIAQERKQAGCRGTCKSVFEFPINAKVGSTSTVYWVWDYSNHFGPTKRGNPEWYTSCIDVQVAARKG